MKEIISNYQDALDIRDKLASKQTNGWHFLYRGHASINFKLLSMVGRKKPFDSNILNSEQRCLNEFKDLVKVENWLQFKIISYNEDMYYMSIGRHLGLDCRLLDWSASLNTALYFASFDKEYSEKDGHLWVMCYPKSVNDSNAKLDPFRVDKFTLVKEDYWSIDDIPINNQPLGIARRFSQNGFFTITPTKQLTKPLDELDIGEVHLFSFIITQNAKEDIRNHLYQYYDKLYLSTTCSIENDIKEINCKYFKQ